MSSSRDTVLELAETRPVVRTRDVVAELGVSRQAAHKLLRRLVTAGRLVREGAGRATRYRLPGPARRVFETDGLEEDAVWAVLRDEVAGLDALSDDARGVWSYAVTEIVNNAIDHSGSATVEVLADVKEASITLEVVDRGVGLFEHVRRSLGLGSEIEALAEVSKGKVTTMPERHSGEGLFFVSKAVDRFEAESGRLRWIVDNVVGDVAVGELDPARRGTRVVLTADPRAPRDLAALFAEHTRDLRFARTRTVVKLFAVGVDFVSRSEAKRLLHGLEKFDEVVLDFNGVSAVGQGFADEVFRVWARANPDVTLEPVAMSEPVAFMVNRSRAG